MGRINLDQETGQPDNKSEALCLSAVTRGYSYFVMVPYVRAKDKHMGKKYVFVFEDPVEYDRCNYNRFLDGIWDETKQQIH